MKTKLFMKTFIKKIKIIVSNIMHIPYISLSLQYHMIYIVLFILLILTRKGFYRACICYTIQIKYCLSQTISNDKIYHNMGPINGCIYTYQ